MFGRSIRQVGCGIVSCDRGLKSYNFMFVNSSSNTSGIKNGFISRVRGGSKSEIIVDK